MAGAIIITKSTSFTIDLQPLIDLGIPFDRKFARIKYEDVRSLNKENDTAQIEIVFTNGEIKCMDFNHIETIDGNPVASQDAFYDAMEAVIFPD